MTLWTPVSTGRSSARVWRGEGIHRKEGPVAEIADEAARLAWLAAHGIPCPKIVEHSPGHLVTTTVPGRPASDLGPAVAPAIGTLLRALHAVPVAACPFDRRLAVTIREAEARAAAGLVDLGNLDAERVGWSSARLIAELHATRPATEDLVVGHGDLCLPNILADEAGHITGVVDVGRLGATDRHNDLAIATRDLAARWSDAAAARFLAAYGVPEPDPAKIAFYRLLDEFF